MNFFNQQPLFVLDHDTFRILDVNAAAVECYGYSKEEFAGMSIFDLGERYDGTSLVGKFQGLDTSAGRIWKHQTKDGVAIYVQFTSHLFSHEGKPIRIAVAHDITALVESFEDLFDSISDAIYILDRDRQFIEVNQSAVELTGYDREYLIGKSPDVLTAPGKVDLEEIHEYFQIALNGETQCFEQWSERRNGEVFPEQVILNPGSYFGENVVIAICRDISQRYRAEEQLRKNEELFQQLFRNAPIGIVMMDEHKEIRIVNEAFEHMFGTYHMQAL